MSAPTAARARWDRLPGWAAPLLLGLLCLLVYNANLRTIGAGDTVPARYLPLVLWHDGTLGLEEHTRLLTRGHPLPETADAVCRDHRSGAPVGPERTVAAQAVACLHLVR